MDEQGRSAYEATNLAARDAVASPFGELNVDVAGKVDPATASAFHRLCRMNKTTRSGAVRDFVYLAVHGKTFDQLCLTDADRRAEWLGGIGPERVLPTREAGEL